MPETSGSVLRSRPFVAVLAAEVVSTTGTQMTWLALPWFVLLTTGSATQTAFVIAAELVGIALLGLPGGRVLARLGARQTMLLCDGLRAPLMALVPLLHWSGALSLPLLVAITFALGCLTAPYFAAQRVILPELLGEGEERMTRANAVLQAATRATLLLGPVLAGVLITVIGAPAVLLVDAASYLVAVTIVTVLVPVRPPLAVDDESRGVLTGLRFLAREPLLRVWSIVFAIGDAAWTAFFVAVPVLVVTRFDSNPKVAGWLLASFGVGALAGNAIAYRLLAPRVDGLKLVAVCIMGQALPLWLLPLPLPAWALSAAIAASGVANGLVNPSIHSILTLRIPPALRPTVMTSAVVVWALMNPLGLFAAGPVLDSAGVTPVLVGFAAVQTVAMAAAGVAAAWARRRDAEAEAVTEPPAAPRGSRAAPDGAVASPTPRA